MKEKREIAISSGTVIMFNKNIKNEIGKRKLPEGEKDVVKFAMQRTPITHSCTIFRADIFKEIEYPDTRVLFEDWWLCLRAIKKGYNIDNQSEVLMYVRSGNEMMKRRRGWKYACEEAKFFFDVCSEGILPWRYGFINLSIRFFVRILPLSFIKILYKYKLHAA
jgi:GT2 family glycosyltransferase